jgi:glycosyltransferase involved in cell wall biosynthesis
MKTIAIFSGYYIPFLGGIERYTQKLSNELVNLGYKVIIVTSNYDTLKDIEEQNNIKIFRIPVFSMFKNRYPIPKINKKCKSILKIVEQEKIDYIICNTRFQLTTFVGCKIAKKLKIIPVIIEHGSSHFTVNNCVFDFFGRIYEHILTFILKNKTDKFYGVSKRCNDWLLHFNIQASGIFYNSVDANTYKLFNNKKYIVESGKIIISYVGRVIREKGIYQLLNCFCKLQSEYNNIVLYIAGDGPILKDLKSKYNKSGIYFLGKLDYDEVISLLNSTDIFIYPSMYSEGLPTSILEAGIMKCAIIATDRGGTKEVISSKKYGLICEENEDSIYENVKILLNDKNLIDELKTNIYDRIQQKFTWQITAKKIVKELEKNNNE